MKRELRATWRGARRVVGGSFEQPTSASAAIQALKRAERKSQSYGVTSAKFRDVTRSDPSLQIEALRESIAKIERRLFKAAKAEDSLKVGKLASLLSNQRARVQMLADKFRSDGLGDLPVVSRDKSSFYNG